jgi:histidine decarboxylase
MKEIVIVSENRPNMLAEVAEAMTAAGVDIEFFHAETIGSSKVAVLIVDRYDAALQALARTPFQAISEDALVIQLDDRPGELARITGRLRDAHIDLHSIRIIRREPSKAIVAVATQNNEAAKDLLKDLLITGRSEA